MKAELVAPCGMNCNVCSAYLAYSHNLPKRRGKITHCIGCLPRDKQCAWLKGNCARLRNGKVRFCYECPTFPCERLMKIDERYRTNYGVSFISNLKEIKKNGVEEFLKGQQKSFKCGKCGDVKSVHNGKCYGCEKIESWKG